MITTDVNDHWHKIRNRQVVLDFLNFMCHLDISSASPLLIPWKEYADKHRVKR